MHIYFTCIILCLLLGFYANLFNVISTTDRSFNFIIENKYQLSLHLGFLLAVLTLACYIFLVRLNNVGIVIQVYDVVYMVKSFLKSLSFPELNALLWFIPVWLVFWISLIRMFYHYLRCFLLSLFLYTYQYKVFSTAYSNYVTFKGDNLFYLMKRVEIFTQNELILRLSMLIWPGIWLSLEPIIFIFIIPSLVIFDYFTQNGEISKVFIILPWYFIYMLLRSSSNLLDSFITFENMQLSRAIYKSLEINGKIYKWVVKPENMI